MRSTAVTPTLYAHSQPANGRYAPTINIVGALVGMSKKLQCSTQPKKYKKGSCKIMATAAIGSKYR